MKGNVALLLLLCACWHLDLVSGHKLMFFKSCPTVQEMPSFKIDDFIGKWFIIEIFKGVNRCMTMTFLKQSDSEMTLSQSREFYLLDKINVDYVNTYTGTLVIDGLANQADMTIKWPANILGSADFKIVDTDYKNYALVYDCQNLLWASRVSFAILSREKTLDGETLNILKQKIRDSGVDPSPLTTVDQSNCIHKEAINDTLDYVDINTFGLLDDNLIAKITDAREMMDLLKWNVTEENMKNGPIFRPQNETGFDLEPDCNMKPENKTYIKSNHTEK